MTTNGSAGRPRPGSLEELRGYLSAAGDLSAIARARLLDAARSAARTEVERAGGAVGLAGAGEVARLRRTVERLERRVAALESGGAGARSTSRPASRGAGRPAPVPRSGRRPTSATGPAGPPAGPAAGTSGPTAGAAGSSTPAPPSPGTTAPPATRSVSGRAADGTTRPPVRRPPPPADGQG